MELSGRRWTLDKRPIIIDIGTAYCKFGLINEYAPMNIIPTSLRTFNIVRESENFTISTLASLCSPTLYKEVEELVYSILYDYLQISPKDKPIILCYSFMTPFPLVKAFTEVLFMIHNVPIIYYFLSNVLPVYTAPETTALVLDCGFYCTQVLAVVKGEIAKSSFKVANIGGFFVKNALAKILREENPGTTLTCHMLEDVIARYGITLTVAQKREFFKEENIAKMKAKKYYTEIQGVSIVISYYARVMCGETLFGDIRDEEENMAYTTLKSLLNAPLISRAFLAGKLIISGGSGMLSGFKRRLLEEMKILLEEEKEFKEISCKAYKCNCIGLKEYIAVQANAFPPNILQWTGASLLGSIKRIDKMCLSKEEYVKNGKELKDKYWELLNANYEKAGEFSGPPRPTHYRRSSSVTFKKRISLTSLNY